MYLHIGNGVNVRLRDIIGIFDLDTATISAVTKKYVNANEREGNIEYGDPDLPRAFVLHEEGCAENKKYKIKLSRISAAGLRLRAEGNDIGE